MIGKDDRKFKKRRAIKELAESKKAKHFDL